MNKFKVGDEVKVVYSLIQEKHKGIYEIKKVIEAYSDEGKQYLYKVGTIKGWARECDIELVGRKINNIKEFEDE